MSLRPTLDFLLHDWLRVEQLCERPRFAEHGRETFGAVLDLSEKLAAERYAPHNREVDVHEPRFDGERVHLPEAVGQALRAHAEAGLRSAGQDYEQGGMQLPYVVEAASRCFFMGASIGIDSYAMLTVANANLLRAHGTPAQQRAFAQPQFEGRFTGTMCLSEPQAGSSLGDILTRAEPDGDGHADDPLGPRFRLRGNKMWISGGEHELGENIVHLVLAKIPQADGRLPVGVKGISLFIVPKWLDLGAPASPHPGPLPQGEGEDGNPARSARLGIRNDVTLAGLNHKLGWRGTVNTLLNFGEGKHLPGGKAGAIGYLVGRPGEGLKGMFHMMNEARIQVGLSATMLGQAGYRAALDYARTRTQGRPGHGAARDPASPQQPIIGHADVRRMLLAQKAYCDGALALGLYCARLVDDKATAAPEAARDAAALLELLTPVAKSWPSEWCLEANSLAIQVHGGYGYTRDFPVEQHWRDNRLNMIHEGTHGIQAQDLLLRKLGQDGGRGWALLRGRMQAAIERAQGQAELAPLGQALAATLRRVDESVAAVVADPARAQPNAVPGLRAIGHTVIAWIWLELACTATTGEPQGSEDRQRRAGWQQAARYFFRHELPHVQAWLQPLDAGDDSALAMQPEWF